MDKLRGKIQTLEEKIFAQTHSQYEIDVMNAQKERAQMFKEGLPTEKIEQWYQQEIYKLKQRLKEDENYGKRPESGRALPEIDYYGRIEVETDIVMDSMNSVTDTLNEAFNSAGDSAKRFGGILDETANKIGKLEFPSYTKTTTDKSQQSSKGEPRITADTDKIKQAAQKVIDRKISDDTDNLKESSINSARLHTDYSNDIQSKIRDTVDKFAGAVQSATLKINESRDKTYIRDSTVDFSKGLNQNVPNGDLAAILRELSQTTSKSTPEIESALAPINKISQDLASISKIAGNIAQSLNQFNQQQKQSPNITISPNININLGGAYVFDDQMKAQLTDDITSEVTGAIKSSVEDEMSRQNLRYG